MLILRRREGQWVSVECRCGCTMRIRTVNIRPNFPGQLDLVVDDEPRHFAIEREERAIGDRLTERN